jgi:uncharacterized membrane protein YkgB
MSFYDDDIKHIEEEDEETRKDHLRFAAGMSDFFAVVLGVVVILILVLLIISLVNWLRQDITSLFQNLDTRQP